jgi:hypothetical protein
MSSKNYVCVTCAQDFTRKYSAYRHNRVLHQEQGKIVRTLEYIIGRLSGEYQSADPILFRSKNRQRTAGGAPHNFPFGTIAHNSPDSHSYENIPRQKEYKPTQRSYYELPEIHSADDGEPRSSKLAEIKGLCKSLFSPPLQDFILRNIELVITKNKGKESILDDYLQRLRQLEALSPQLSSLIPKTPVMEKSPLSLHRYLGDLPQAAKNTLAEIEKEMTCCSDEPTVWEEIERLANEYRNTGDFSVLDKALTHYKKNG